MPRDVTVHAATPVAQVADIMSQYERTAESEARGEPSNYSRCVTRIDLLILSYPGWPATCGAVCGYCLGLL